MDSKRRDLLRYSGLGLAALSAPALTPAVAAAANTGSKPLSAPMAGPLAGLHAFDVTRYGATGDGKTVDSPAINRAIEAAAAVGGGMVVFPAGTYMSFSIRLKSNIHLYLGQGATLLAADSPLPGEATGYHGGVYDPAGPAQPWEAYQDYGHNHWRNALIWGEEIENVSITGPGCIWGRGLSNNRGSGEWGTPFKAAQPGVGDKAIALKNCHHVLLRDFSILKGGHFGLLLTAVDNLTIDNLTIDTDRDGMDIDCCQNVRVSNCTVNSPWDDGICLKSSYALGYRRDTRNVTISSCFVSGCYELGSVLDGSFRKFPEDDPIWRTGRIKCGTESNGGFINITITNCVFEGCYGYALESVDGAQCEDITISNTTMRDLTCGPLFFRLGARLRGPKQSTKVGTLRRVLVSNLDCYAASQSFCSILAGITDYPVEDVKLSNIYIEAKGGQQKPVPDPARKPAGYPDPGMFGTTPSYGFFLRNVKNLEMSHVELALEKQDIRPAFYLDTVERADFFAITAPRTEGGAFSLHRVQDFRVGWSRATPDRNLSEADGLTL